MPVVARGTVAPAEAEVQIKSTTPPNRGADACASIKALDTGAPRKADQPSETTSGARPAEHASQPTRMDANSGWRTYRCPACNAAVQSTVVNGNVNTRGHCGRQFRVAAGQVCRSYLHTCPTCNTTVEAAKPDGRIQKKHKDSTGRVCKTYQWKSQGSASGS